MSNADIQAIANRIRRHKTKWQDLRPFRLKIQLSAPVALNHPWIALDGLIAHLQLREVLGEDYYVLPAKYPLGRLLAGQTAGTIPLKRSNKLWHASVSWFEPSQVYLETIYKRFEDKHVTGYRWRKARIYQNMGYYRSHMLQEPYISAHTCIFWGCGDLEAIGRLMTLLVGIGNDTRIGFGAVHAWNLEPLDKDESLVRDGRANRPIPTRYLRRWSDAVYMAWRPPYWAPECVELCAPPGAEVDLGPGIDS